MTVAEVDGDCRRLSIGALTRTVEPIAMELDGAVVEVGVVAAGGVLVEVADAVNVGVTVRVAVAVAVAVAVTVGVAVRVGEAVAVAVAVNVPVGVEVTVAVIDAVGVTVAAADSRRKYSDAAQPVPRLVSIRYQAKPLALVGPSRIVPSVPRGIEAMIAPEVEGDWRRLR
jgi:hypothetical protein